MCIEIRVPIERIKSTSCTGILRAKIVEKRFVQVSNQDLQLINNCFIRNSFHLSYQSNRNSKKMQKLESSNIGIKKIQVDNSGMNYRTTSCCSDDLGAIKGNHTPKFSSKPRNLQTISKIIARL